LTPAVKLTRTNNAAIEAPGPISVRCRQIEERDLPRVIALLTEGFRAQRGRDFWVNAMARLAAHDTPDDLPRFGYLLESEGEVVGVILLIFARVEDGDALTLRCNLSSWYVAEKFRPYGPLLISRALKHRQATYCNLTPAPHTLPILEAQGFRRSCEGRYIALPALARSKQDVAIVAMDRDSPGPAGLRERDAKLLRRHAEYGCLCLVCVAAGVATPFVFAPRRKFGFVGVAVLAYCRDMADFVRFAGPLGRFLLRRGYPLVSVDANGALPGLWGKFDRSKPQYFRGPHRPRLGDALFTERTMLGS
jgi:hypothetical protein